MLEFNARIPPSLRDSKRLGFAAQASLPFLGMITPLGNLLQHVGGIFACYDSLSRRSYLCAGLHASSIYLMRYNSRSIMFVQSGLAFGDSISKIGNGLYQRDITQTTVGCLSSAEKCIFIASLIFGGAELIVITLIAQVVMDAYRIREFKSQNAIEACFIQACLVGIRLYGLHQYIQRNDLSCELVKNQLFKRITSIHKVATATFREVGAMFSCGLNHLKGRETNFQYYDLNPNTLSQEQLRNKAVVLLHGSGGNQAQWLPLAQKLQQRNISPVFTLNFSEETRVQELDVKIREIQKLYGNNPLRIVLVGHSLGAITSANWLFNYPEKVENVDVDKIISVAGRLKVTESNFRFFFEDLIPSINATFEKLDPAKIYAIAGDHDILVPQAAIFVNQPNQRLLLENEGHLSVQQAEATMNQIIEWLR